MSTLRERFQTRTSPPSNVAGEAKIGVRVARAREQDTGKGSTSLSAMTVRDDKMPHPPAMLKYDDYNRDPEVRTAIDIYTEMVSGGGFYVEMPKGMDPEHPNVKKIEDLKETKYIDEDIKAAVRVMYEKGFCPIERLQDGSLKLMPPETFFVWRHSKEKDPFKFTQELSTGGTPVAVWEGENLGKIVLFVRNESPVHPYGVALCDSVMEAIDARRAMSKDVPAIIHKVGYPFRVWLSKRKTVMDAIYEQVTQRAADEDVFIDNVDLDEIKVMPELMSARINFSEFVTRNDELIAEGLNAPLLMYLRNATEASATKILESVDRNIDGTKQQLARRIEKKIFLPFCGEPVPKMVWGEPRTGIEDITLDAIVAATSAGVFTFEQSQDLLKKMGLPLIEAVKPLVPPPIAPGFEPTAMPPVIQSRLRDALNIVAASHAEKHLTFGEACTEANKVIEVFVDQARNEARKCVAATTGTPCLALSESAEREFRVLALHLQDGFRQRLLPTGVRPGHEHEPTREYLVQRR